MSRLSSDSAGLSKLGELVHYLGPPHTREIVIDSYLYSTTKMTRQLEAKIIDDKYCYAKAW